MAKYTKANINKYRNLLYSSREMAKNLAIKITLLL